MLPALLKLQHKALLLLLLFPVWCCPRLGRGPTPYHNLLPHQTSPRSMMHASYLLSLVVYWGVYAGIRRIPTSWFFLTAYTHLSDHK